MSIRPIDFNGMMQNTQEVSHTRASEENKPNVQQQTGFIAQQTQIEESMHQVHEQADSDAEKALDPEGGGGASYSRRRKKKKKDKDKKKNPSAGSVSLKSEYHSFDVTI